SLAVDVRERFSCLRTARAQSVGGGWILLAVRTQRRMARLVACESATRRHGIAAGVAAGLSNAGLGFTRHRTHFWSERTPDARDYHAEGRRGTATVSRGEDSDSGRNPA